MNPLNQIELNEIAIQDYIKNKMTVDTFQYRFYRPNALKLLKPSVFINRSTCKWPSINFIYFIRKKFKIKLEIKYIGIKLTKK